MSSRCDTRIIGAMSDITNPETNPNPIFASSQMLRLLNNNKWNDLLDLPETIANDNTISIPQIPHHIMDGIIKYIKGTFINRNPEPIPVCDENVQEYFEAAQFLQMEDIKTSCLDYLNSRVSTVENIPFLFNLIGTGVETGVGGFDESRTFSNVVHSKIRDFLIQNAHQLDVVVRKCKEDGVPEDTLTKSLCNLLKSKTKASNGDLIEVNPDCDWNFDFKKLLPVFSNQENQLVLLETCFETGDAAGKAKAFCLLLNMVRNPTISPIQTASKSSSEFSCQHEEQNGPIGNNSLSESASTQNQTGIEVNSEEFQVNLANFHNLPPWLQEQMEQMEKNDAFPSFTFVNHCFFESKSLRQEFRFISPYATCTENQSENRLCDPHLNCTNKFNLMEENPAAAPVFIKKSSISGIGLFAKSQLVQGQVICPYGGKITKKCTDIVYPMDIFDGKRNNYTIDASKYGNLGRFTNGELNATPNVAFVGVLGSSRAMSVLVVVKEIATGEEIIAEYGEQYWKCHEIAMDRRNGNTDSSGSFTAKSKSKSIVNDSEMTEMTFPCSSGSLPVPSEPRARKSCKSRRIQISETNTIDNNGNEKGTDSDSENSEENENMDSTSFANGDWNSSSESKSEVGPLGLLNPNPNPVFSPQGLIYFLLGTRQEPKGLELWSFNIKTRELIQEGNLPPVFQDRRRLAMLHHQGDIYFMGGEDCFSGKLTNEAHIFNVESRHWRLTEMIESRFDFKAVVCNNSLYTVGGCLERARGPEYEELGTNVVEKLKLIHNHTDVPSAKWENDSYLINCRSDAGLVVLNQKLYAIGGCVAEKKGGVMRASSLCESFDPTTDSPIFQNQTQNQWIPTAPLKYKRLGLASVVTGDRIFALGGATTEKEKGLNFVEVYNPVSNTWEDGPPMNRSRKFFSAVLFDSCIYAIGGDDENGENEPTMEKYDLKTEKWTVECGVKRDGYFGTTAFR